MSTTVTVSNGRTINAHELACSNRPTSKQHYSGVYPLNQKKNSFSFYSSNRSGVKAFSLLAAIVAVLCLSSCQKESFSEPTLNSTADDAMEAAARRNNGRNRDAGSSEIVVYPASSSATISGSSSNAKRSVSYHWEQIGGNSTATIAQPNSAKTGVSDLKPGLYTFTRTATDNSGFSSVDTSTVSVLEKITWTIEGVTREALVHPATGNYSAAPVIFAFHGHGGTDLRFAEKAFELSWPEAIVVYAQGLPTKGNSDAEGKMPGWQHAVGEVNNHTGIKDQDLKFFDAMYATVTSKYQVNTQQVFIHGWSNGANFVYDVLWPERTNKIAALAPACATVNTTKGKQPTPIIHVAGTDDSKCAFNKQKKNLDDIRNLNECTSNGTPWASGPGGLSGTHYDSRIDDPVVFLQYNGPHAYPVTVSPFIVKFFKEVIGE